MIPGSMPDSQSSLNFELAKGERQVLFPVKLAANDGKNALKVKHSDVEIEVPAEVLKELQALVTGSGLEQSQISFQMGVLSPQLGRELLDRAESKNQAAVSAAGEVYDFKLSIVKADGTVLELKKFSQPVTIRLSANENSQRDLTGIYYIADDGSLEYMGGNRSDGKWTAKVSHFSTFAVLTYDKTFEDVNASYWAHDVIKKMAARQMVSGISETAFAPKQNVSRAEFAALITRALSIKSANTAIFKDVDSAKWYASSITAAYENGIITGRSADTFAPEESVSREEMAAMIYKAYLFHTGRNAAVNRLSSFRDADHISSWAADAVAAAQELGLISGRGNQLFMPHEEVIRAESAQVISLLLERIEEQKER